MIQTNFDLNKISLDIAWDCTQRYPLNEKQCLVVYKNHDILRDRARFVAKVYTSVKYELYTHLGNDEDIAEMRFENFNVWKQDENLKQFLPAIAEGLKKAKSAEEVYAESKARDFKNIRIIDIPSKAILYR